MLKTLSEWFQEQLQKTEKPTSRHTVELATAVLLYEIMRADNSIEQVEQATFEQLLSEHFSLSQQEQQELHATTKEQADKAVDFQQFTSVLNDNCSAQEKRDIVESLWKMAYADKHIDVHETHLIRRVSDLLHVRHSEFIQAKLKVTESP